MTIIIGVKKAGQVWIGSDARVSYGDYVLDPMSTDSKLVKMKHAVIGAAGDLTFRNFMELFVSRGDNGDYEFTDKLSVMEFFICFKKFLKRHAGLGESELNQVQNLYNSNWLVATKDRLFEMNEDGAILEIDKYGTIGSGSIIASATLDYIQLYEPELGPEEMLKRAHDMAVKRVSSCGGDQVRVNVTELLSVEEPTE